MLCFKNSVLKEEKIVNWQYFKNGTLKVNATFLPQWMVHIKLIHAIKIEIVHVDFTQSVFAYLHPLLK